MTSFHFCSLQYNKDKTRHPTNPHALENLSRNAKMTLIFNFISSLLKSNKTIIQLFYFVRMSEWKNNTKFGTANLFPS